jgi:hypothetical protein
MHEMAPLLNPTRGNYMTVVKESEADTSAPDNNNWKLDRKII